MRSRAILAVLLSLLVPATLLATRPARAEVEASATRLTVGGGPARFYMTYGHADEPELYAPIVQELRRLQVTFQRSGTKYAVYHKGQHVGTWSVFTSRDDVPETAENPVLLLIGGQLYVPVRGLAEVCGVNVRWDARANTMALVPDLTRPRPAVGAQPPVIPSPAPRPLSLTTLAGVSIEPHNGGVQVRVEADGVSTPVWSTVTKPAPLRLVLDFPRAQWSPNVQLPAPTGPVLALRTGHPTAGTARLVLEIPSLAVRVTGVSVKQDVVVASIGQGAAAVRAQVDPTLQAQVDPKLQAQITAIKRRNAGLRAPQKVAARGSAGDLTPPQPSVIPPLRVRAAGSLAGKVICVDAGHGGHSKGAAGLSNLEKDLCLQMSLQFRDALVRRGAKVIMTRDSDTYVSLQGRCDIANASGADLFISIHCNSTESRNSASGTETYWYTNGGSLRLARALHKHVVGNVNGLDRGIRQRGFYVIRRTTMPSVLLEIAFINHRNDEQILSTPQFQSNLGESLAQGVLDYFGTDVAAN